MSYRRFFLIRLAQALFALWLVATLVFVMFFVLLPEPERNLFGGKQATPAMVAHTTREFHLRASLPEQYARYMWRLVAHQSAGARVTDTGMCMGLRRGLGSRTRECSHGRRYRRRCRS